MPEYEKAGAIEDAATIWAAKAERGLTAEERIDLDQWLEGDSRRLGAFVRAQAAWIHAERAKALGKMPEPELPEAGTASSKRQPRAVTLSRRLVFTGGGVAVASIAAAGIYGVGRERTIESGVGEIRRMSLLNGTILMLDTDTRVEVADHSHDLRLHLTQGCVFLDVPALNHLALSLRVSDVVMRIVKGSFGVQFLPNAPLTALVTKGEVAVSQRRGLFSQEHILVVGQNHALSLPPGRSLRSMDVWPVSVAQRDRLLAWRDGMLSFGGEALADAVKAFDRYGSVRIVVDPELGRQRITGLFRADDPRGFATAIAASFGAAVISQGDNIRISSEKVPSG